jgi:molybdate transport system ATP-binding protein
MSWGATTISARLGIHLELTVGGFSLDIAEDLALAPITAIFGPSGAGKTTLLRVIAGLEQTALGRLALNATNWQDSVAGRFVPAHQRQIGYVFQDGRLFPHLTVAGNLQFARRLTQRTGKFAYADVIRAMDLGDLLARRPRTLSGGEQQRVAIGRALLRDPELMLMDEPLSALDVKRKSEILPYIERVAHDFDVPILYVTHSIEEVSRLASHMLMLSDGRIAAVGSVAAVLERVDLWPLTGPAAGTVLAARIEATDAGMSTLVVAGQRLRIPAIAGTPGATIQLRIAAKDVAIALTKPVGLSIRNVLQARILKIDKLEPVLAEILLEVGGQHLRAEITREAATELGLARDQTVYALIKSAAIDRTYL